MERRSGRKFTAADFRGLMVPVFTCFLDDDPCTLDLQNIDKYAAFLKKERVKGILGNNASALLGTTYRTRFQANFSLVNSITGEGPNMSLTERKTNAEKWWQAAMRYELMCMVQIGGAPLPDVIEMAIQAESLGVHGVLCLPELFYKPTTIESLVGYCALIAKHCPTRPFFYYHLPKFTGVYFSMNTFCREAEKFIPTFFGIQHGDADLDSAYRCLKEGRTIFLGTDMLLASGLFLGFDSAALSCLNIRPDLGVDIYNAMQGGNLALAKEKQRLLNNFLRVEQHNFGDKNGGWVATMKNWFNVEKRAQFSAGPIRKWY